MTKRIAVTLPDKTYTDLKTRAELEGRTVADLASYLLQRCFEDDKDKQNS